MLAGALCALVPIGAIVLPAFWAYAMHRTRPWYLALFAAAEAAVIWALGPSLPAFCLAGLNVGMAAVLFYMQGNRFGNAYTALTMLGVGLIALYASVCLPGILAGRGAFDDVQTAMDATLALMRELLAQTPGATPALMDTAEEYFSYMSQTIASMVVPVLCIAAGVLALCNLLLFHLFAAKAHLAVPPLRRFCDWAIPQSMTFGLMFLLVASFVAEWTGWIFAEGLTGTVEILILMPLCLQGLCVIDFLIVKRNRHVALRRTLIYLCVAFLPMFAQMPLMIVSCADQIFRLRARAATPPMQG